jgi:hypothetical protein
LVRCQCGHLDDDLSIEIFVKFRPKAYKVSDICKSIPRVPKSRFSAADQKKKAELSNVAIGGGCLQLILFVEKPDPAWIV